MTPISLQTKPSLHYTGTISHLERFIYRYLPHTVQYEVQPGESGNWNDVSFGQLRPAKCKTEIITKWKIPLHISV